MTTEAPSCSSACAIERPMPREPPVTSATLPFSISVEYLLPMTTVAVLGAGELGGAIAHALATRDRVARILLVDAAGSAAAGKALDIQQMGSVDRFHTRLDGTDDQSRVAGCAACLVADRFGKAPVEWHGDEAVTMITRLAPWLGEAPL